MSVTNSYLLNGSRTMNHKLDYLIDWLIDWLTDWLVDWLVDWLFGWLINWLVDRLLAHVCLTACLHCRGQELKRDATRRSRSDSGDYESRCACYFLSSSTFVLWDEAEKTLVPSRTTGHQTDHQERMLGRSSMVGPGGAELQWPYVAYGYLPWARWK